MFLPKVIPKVRGFIPNGTVACWNNGRMGLGILKCWINAKIRLCDKDDYESYPLKTHHSTAPFSHE